MQSLIGSSCRPSYLRLGAFFTDFFLTDFFFTGFLRCTVAFFLMTAFLADFFLGATFFFLAPPAMVVERVGMMMCSRYTPQAKIGREIHWRLSPVSGERGKFGARRRRGNPAAALTYTCDEIRRKRRGVRELQFLMGNSGGDVSLFKEAATVGVVSVLIGLLLLAFYRFIGVKDSWSYPVRTMLILFAEALVYFALGEIAGLNACV
jgi:hypothetical protein